jgi:hypothetical protein
VHINMVKRALHRMSNVPRTLGEDTKPTTSEGNEQFGLKVLDAELDCVNSTDSSK